MCLKFAKSIIRRYKKSRVDIGVTNLYCPWNWQCLPYNNTKIKGWMLTFKSTMYLKFAKSTIQTYKIQGWTLALQAYSVLEICKCYHTKIPKFKGGRWRYDVGVTNLQYGWNLQSLPYKALALQTYRVRGRWRYKLTMWLKFAESTIQRYKDCGHWRYKLTVALKVAKPIPIQRCKKSRVDVRVTNLQCAWNLQTSPYKGTKILRAPSNFCIGIALMQKLRESYAEV